MNENDFFLAFTHISGFSRGCGLRVSLPDDPPDYSKTFMIKFSKDHTVNIHANFKYDLLIVRNSIVRNVLKRKVRDEYRK